MPHVLHPLFNDRVVTTNKEQRLKSFHLTLEGDGVCGNEVLFGSGVRLVFHVPKLAVEEGDSCQLGFSVIPHGLRYLDQETLELDSTRLCRASV